MRSTTGLFAVSESSPSKVVNAERLKVGGFCGATAKACMDVGPLAHDHNLGQHRMNEAALYGKTCFLQ